MNVAYIQARGGSKRFPRKALAEWNGKPLIVDAIDKLHDCGLFHQIFVSSDDPEILAIATRHGVFPLWRSPLASSDKAADDDVAAEVLSYFGPEVDIVAKVYPCIPLLESSDMFAITASLALTQYPGMYFTDKKRKDAGAMYVFRLEDYKKVGSLALDLFPWIKVPIENACDINTPSDLEKAKRMANGKL